MSSANFLYSPNQTVFAIDRNSFLITELIVVDGRYKAFTRNGILEEQFQYTTKTPRLEIYSDQPEDLLYETLEDAADALFNAASEWDGALPTYSIDYLARPPETIYFVHNDTLAIYSGIVESVHIKTFLQDSSVVDSIEYQVRTDVNNEVSYTKVKEGDIFLSYEEAYESLFGIIPTPSPTVTLGLSPTPTPTPSTTMPLTPTPTASATITPTVTPTMGVSTTPMASVTPTPSATLSATATPSPTPSATATPSPTPAVSPIHGIPDLLLTSRVNGSGTNLLKGMVVSLNKSGELVRASSTVADIDADCSSATRYLGIVYDDSIPPGGVGRILLEGSINNTDTNWANIILGGSPLHSGSKYYLSETAGLISASPPNKGFIKQIGFAATNRTLDLRFGPLIKLRSL